MPSQPQKQPVPEVSSSLPSSLTSILPHVFPGAETSALQRRGLRGGTAAMGQEGRHARLYRGWGEPREGAPAGEEAEGQGEEEGEGDVDAAAGWSVGAAEETAAGPADVLPEVGVNVL